MTWAGLHCHLHWGPESTDRFLSDTVGPMMRALRDQGGIADWFFIRYSDDGPHLRIRLRNAGPQTAARVATRLRAAVSSAALPCESRLALTPGTTLAAHGEVREIGYEPEVARYGGAEAIGVAERMFCRSTEITLALLAQRLTPAHRLATALDLTLATAVALGLDQVATQRWLRHRALRFRQHIDAAGLAIAPPTPAAQEAGVARRWRAVTVAAAVGHGHIGRWAAEVRAAHTELRGMAVGRPLLGVWSAQLHMLCNRLALRWDEEHGLNTLLAVSLPQPESPICPMSGDRVEKRLSDCRTMADAHALHDIESCRPGISSGSVGSI